MPVGHRRALGKPLPPRLIVRGHRHIRENRVLANGFVRVAVGLRVGARDHAEIARLGIYRIQPAVFPRVQPRYVIAHRPNLPAPVGGRRNQHGQVRLAASGWERAREVVNLSLRILDADDQHVLREPPFGACLPAGDAQCVAFLAQERIAAIARSEALDREFFRKVHDEATVGIQIAGGVQPLHKRAVIRDALERRNAHAGHQLHVEHHIGAVGDLDATAREWRIDGAHAVRHHVQRASLHAPGEQRIHLLMSVLRGHPIIVGAGVFLILGANEREVFDTRHVGRIGAIQMTTGKLALIERQQLLLRHQLSFQHLKLRLAAVAPINAIRLGEPSHLVNPVCYVAVQRGERREVMWCRSHENPRVSPVLD